MSEMEQANELVKEMNRVINHFRREFDVNYATVIGCLDIVKMDMFLEMKDVEEEEE